MTEDKLKNGPAIILVEPQLGENIGTAARAMANFCVFELRLVNPRDGWPSEAAIKAAAGADHVVQNAKVYDHIDEAVADLHYVLATTARPRDMVKQVFDPEQAIAETGKRLKINQNIGILFGRERVGLKNDEIALADAIVMAPVNPDFASLNIAQAVLLICYEWLKHNSTASLGRETDFDGPGIAGMNLRGSRLATKQELIGFYEHLERELDDSGFLRPPEKRATMVRNIRNMFQRIGASEQEVRTLRGIVASLTRVHRRNKKMS